MDVHPYILVGRCYYAQALEYVGDVEQALREYRTACSMLPGLTWLRILEGTCLSKSGRKNEALAILEEMQETRKTEYIDAYYFSLLYDALGMRDLAFAELERAGAENSITLCLVDVDPKVDALRQDPRFAALHRRIFEPASFSLSGSSQRC